MASTPIRGETKGFCKIVTGTETAFCRRVTGGSFRITSHDIETEGVNSLTDTVKGVEEMDVSVTCYGVLQADLVHWFPTTVVTNIAAMPDFVLQGSWGGLAYDWLLESCEPVSASCKCEGNGLFTADLALKAIATRAAAGTYDAVYNTNVCHRMPHVTATISGAAQGLTAFSVESNFSTEMELTGDGVATYPWQPDGFLIHAQHSTCQTTTRNPFALADLNATTKTERSIVIALDNGQAAEDLTFTLADWIHDGSYDIPFAQNQIDGYANSWKPGPGNVYGRVVLT